LDLRAQRGLQFPHDPWFLGGEIGALARILR
jgi:hypothetical protein